MISLTVQCHAKFGAPKTLAQLEIITTL